jgi:hypothetical protein
MQRIKICGGLACLMLLSPIHNAYSQATVAGASCVGMAGISSVTENVWAVVNNPAGLARYGRFSLATGVEQRYLMPELGNYSLAGSLPVKNGCFALSGLITGYKSWLDQEYFLGYGRLFGNSLLAGLSLVYVNQKAADQSFATHQISYELGTIVLVSPKLKLAFATFNPFGLSFKSRSYASLPSTFKLGLSYRYSESFSLQTELYKDLDYPIVYRVGAEYSFHKIFIIRCGVKGFPFSWSFGASVNYHKLWLEFASSFHQYLGYTPALSIQYDVK